MKKGDIKDLIIILSTGLLTILAVYEIIPILTDNLQFYVFAILLFPPVVAFAAYLIIRRKKRRV
jgi:hypothetical protein